jgi:hypothetical protein
MARVVRFHEVGGPEVLKIEEIEVPPPKKGEVQLSIKAIGLNRAESMFRSGQYLEEPKRRTRRRELEADHRQDVPARRDRRGTPLPEIEPTDWQGRGDGVRTACSEAGAGECRRSKP